MQKYVLHVHTFSYKKHVFPTKNKQRFSHCNNGYWAYENCIQLNYNINLRANVKLHYKSMHMEIFKYLD